MDNNNIGEIIQQTPSDNKKSGYLTAFISNPGEIKYRKKKPSVPRANEVLVKMIGCEIDSSNIAVWEGVNDATYPTPLGSPGRGGWGIVEAAGDNSSFDIGEVVAVLCDNTFAEKVVCNKDDLVRIPDPFERRIFPTVALAKSYQIWSRCDIQREDTVLIIGGGFIATMMTYLCEHIGAHSIQLCNSKNIRNTAHFKWDEIEDLKDHIAGKTNHELCDKVIECTGTSFAFDQATSFVRDNGNVILAKRPFTGIIPINEAKHENFNIITAYDFNKTSLKESLKKVVEMVNRGQLLPEAFVNRTFSYYKLNEAYNDLAENSLQYMRTCLLF